MKVIPTHGSPRSRTTIVVSILAAIMLTIMLMAQLFGYEDFAVVLEPILPFNDTPLTNVLAGVIIFGELLALPYLLGMYMSKLLRILSALFGITIGLFWLLLALSNSHALNSGLFSSTLELPGGLVAAVWSFLLFGLVAKVIAADSKFRHSTTS